MFKMKRNAIELTQGDSAEFMVEVNDYDVSASDNIIFTVKGLFSKTIGATTKYITILPSDTRSANPGVYLYDIQLTRQDGNIYTIVEPNIFTLVGDITQPAPTPPEPEDDSEN